MDRKVKSTLVTSEATGFEIFMAEGGQSGFLVGVVVAALLHCKVREALKLFE